MGISALVNLCCDGDAPKVHVPGWIPVAPASASNGNKLDFITCHRHAAIVKDIAGSLLGHCVENKQCNNATLKASWLYYYTENQRL